MKKIPERMCIACRTVKPKSEMIRIVRNKDGEYSIDLKGKAPGRGAYVCDDIACVERCIKSKGLNKTFEENVPKEVYDKLMEEYVAKKQG